LTDLLDTHVLLAVLGDRLSKTYPQFEPLLSNGSSVRLASIASVWEIAIKYRLGKLKLDSDLDDYPDVIELAGLSLLPIKNSHVLAELDVMPPTRDPFDRLLLAQCQIENCQLMTADKALIGHPLVVSAN
jgi:PIN domain nuclease of toxin-antitoxin system